jgi:hypothetical protein
VLHFPYFTTCGQVEQRWIWHVSTIVFCGVDDSVQSMGLICHPPSKQSATSADHWFYTRTCTMVFSTEKADQHLFITFFRSEVLLLFGEVWNWKIKSGMCLLTCIAMKVFHFQRLMGNEKKRLQHLSTITKWVGVHVHPNCSSTCFTVESSYGLFFLQMNQHHCW